MFIKALSIGAIGRPGQGGRSRRSHNLLPPAIRADGCECRGNIEHDGESPWPTAPSDPRGLQPVAAARRRRSVRHRPAAAGGGGGEWRRRRSAGAGEPSARHWGRAEMFEQARLANENPPPAFDAGPATWSSSIRPITASWPRACAAGLHCLDLAARTARAPAAPAEVARAARYLHGGAGRERAHVPDHHDARLGGGAGGEPALARAADAEDHLAQLRPALPAVVGEVRHHARHGHDREAGRHRRARQHHARRGGRRRLIASPATNGSCRRRCRTRSWCWRRPPAG